MSVLFDVGAAAFYALLLALVAGRVGLFVLKVGNFDSLARTWANGFNRLTVYLR